MKRLHRSTLGIIWDECMLTLPVPNSRDASWIYPDLAAGWKEQTREVTIHARLLKTALKQATKEVTGTADLPSPHPGLMT